VKESLFSILGPRLVGQRIVDLCCGSGGLGIEALSRGAAHVTFVDTSFAALQSVRANLSALEAEKESRLVVRGDAVSWLRRFLIAGEGNVWILADPPYEDETGLKLAALAFSQPDRILGLVLEHALDMSPECPEGWTCDLRRYGRTTLSILEHSS